MNVRLFCGTFLAVSLMACPSAEADTLLQDWVTRLSDRDLLRVDRQGHLWTWSGSSARIEIFTQEGELLADIRIPQVKSLDVDVEWGITALVGQGHELRTVALDGRTLHVLPLDQPMGDVVWTDAHQVAMSPTLSEHRVQIWDLEARKLLRTLGEETPILPAPGAQFSRSVDLAYDHGQNRLFSVESRTGDLQVFKLTGERIGRSQLKNPRLEEFDRWLAGIDLQGLRYFRLSLDRRGQAWAVQSCSEQNRAVLVRVSPSAATAVVEVETSCCSTRSLIAGDHLILHRPPGQPGGPCVHVMEVPE